MPGEIVTIQIGGAGNRFGLAWWQKVTTELHVDVDGNELGNQNVDCLHDQDKKHVFLRESTQQGKWQARCVVADMDCTDYGLDHFTNVYDAPHRAWTHLQDDACFSFGDSSCGRNWAKGYYSFGPDMIDDVLDNCRSEAEKCDSLDSWQIFFSLGGGTGSGMGCLLAEKLNDDYPNCSVIPNMIMPNYTEDDELGCLPYNIMLTSAHLDKSVQASIMLRNAVLSNVAHRMGKSPRSYASLNEIAAEALAGVTCGMRCNTRPTIAAASSLSALAADMTPLPNLRFLKLGIAEMMQLEGLNAGRCFSMLAVTPPKVCSNLNDIGRRAFFNASVTCANAAPGGAFIANHASMTHVFEQLVDVVDPLLRRRSFLMWYTGEGMDYEEMQEGQDALIDIVGRYREASVPSIGARVEVLRDSEWHRGVLIAKGERSIVKCADDVELPIDKSALNMLRACPAAAGLEHAIWNRGARQHLPPNLVEAISQSAWRVWSCRTRP